MPVYVDNMRTPYRGMLMSHLVADTLEELHGMADRLGLRRAWFQPKSTPHYDVSVAKREEAIRLGAQPVTREGLVAVIRRWRAQQGASA